MKDYLKINTIPILIEIIFVISCFFVPKQYIIYTNFLFYLFLLIYFIYKKEISIKKWLNSLKSGIKFWKQTIITLVFLIIAFGLSMLLERLFPNFDTGMILLRTDTVLKIIIFIISTIFFPAIIEETFFRKSLISFKNKKVLYITTIFSMFLFALEHSLTLWGILLVMLWALPLSISYIKTKNIYVPMTAHFIGDLLGNGIDIIMAIISLL